MALGRTTTSLSNFIRNSFLFSDFRAKLPSKISSAAACMISKELRDPEYKKPDPWPYETKKFGYLQACFLGTEHRLGENSRILVVDGNIGAGKTALAKQLAEKFDMKFIPEPTMDMMYITAHGYDLRLIDPIVPPSFKSCDIKTYYSNPHHQNVQKFQMRMFMLRYLQYIDALAHLLNTGEGIVMERCVYADFVFLEAMYQAGYISDDVRTLYYDVSENCLPELMRPHLVVYLDISPQLALKRIKERNDPVEVKSKVLTENYLTDLEHIYKQDYLKKMEKHAEILIYDWSNFGDLEVVVEDIERIDLDRYDHREEKMTDWRLWSDWDFGEARRRYTNERWQLLDLANIYRPRVGEVFHPAGEVEDYIKILEKVPGMNYQEGFNPDFGDDVVFKTHQQGYREKPRLFFPI